MADPTVPGRFTREGGRNRFTARRATVLRVERVAPPIIRVTVSGPEFEDFTSGGPARNTFERSLIITTWSDIPGM